MGTHDKLILFMSLTACKLDGHLQRELTLLA